VNELGPLFTHPGDLSDPIPGGFAIAVALVALAFCLYALVRGQVSDALLGTSIVSLPLLAFAVTGAVLVERSKETEFCVSCHIMGPLRDTVTEQDTSLASVHITRGAVPTAQSCYTCHSGYGLQGDMQAKLAGVGHMLAELSGSYDLPLTLHGDFDLKSCLGCHAESSGFRGQPAHQPREIQDAVLSGQMRCTGMCHPAAHPPEALTGEMPQ
jgi:hypothetical protein